jgi:hypothetical protein
MQARPANEIMKRTIQKLLLPAVGLLLVAASIVQPVAAAGRMPEGQSAWLPPLPAMRRDRRIAPRRNNRLIYRTPEGRHLSRGKPDPAIDFGATKIDGARLFALQFLKNEGCASNGKARRIRFVRASGCEVPAPGIRSCLACAWA